MAEKTAIDYEGLKEILPQAHPFILIDRIEEYVKDVSLVAIKNVTGNEWAFEGDVEGGGPRYFPETLMIEAAARMTLLTIIVISCRIDKIFISKKIYDKKRK